MYTAGRRIVIRNYSTVNHRGGVYTHGPVRNSAVFNGVARAALINDLSRPRVSRIRTLTRLRLRWAASRGPWPRNAGRYNYVLLP